MVNAHTKHKRQNALVRKALLFIIPPTSILTAFYSILIYILWCKPAYLYLCPNKHEKMCGTGSQWVNPIVRKEKRGWLPYLQAHTTTPSLYETKP